MNKLEKIRELKKEISCETQEHWGCSGRSSYEILTDILSLMEEDAKEVSEDVCCGKFETCNEACVPRANYFKENSRVELNKLALSILKESLKDSSYRQTWESNIAMAFYDAYVNERGVFVYNGYEHRNRAAKLFMSRLFGEIE